MATPQNPNYTVHILQNVENGTPIEIFAPLASEQFMMDLSASYQAPWSGGLFGEISKWSSVALGVIPVTQGLTAQVWSGSTETELGIDLALQAEFDAETEVRGVIKQLYKLVTPSVNSLGFLSSPGPSIDWKKVLQNTATAANNAGYTTLGSGVSALANNVSSPISPGTQKTGQMTDTSQTITDGGQASQPTSNPSTDQSLGTNSSNNLAGFVKNKISLSIGQKLYFDSVVLTNVQVTEENQFDSRGYPLFARVSLRFKPLFIITQSDLDNIFTGPPNSTAGANPQLGVFNTSGSDTSTNPIDTPASIPDQSLDSTPDTTSTDQLAQAPAGTHWDPAATWANGQDTFTPD